MQYWQDVLSEMPQEIASQLLPPDPKKTKGRPVEQLQLVPADLTAREHTVFKLLSADEPVHIDQFDAATQLSIPELTGALLGLEMREFVH